MKRYVIWLALLVVGTQAVPCAAESKTYQLTVAAGDQDRTNVPVTVLIPLPASLAKAQSAVVQDSSGKALPAQLTGIGVLSKTPAGGDSVAKEVHFILPSLKANASGNFEATISTDPPAKAEAFSWQDTKGDFTDLKFGDRPVLRYMYTTFDDSSKDKRELTYKVYHHLYDPDGQRLVTKGAGGLYPHHRGLYFGFNQITYGENKKADIWHCTGDAHQTHEKFLASEAGPVLGRHRLEIAWHGQGKEVFAKEERELTVYNVPGGQLVEFATRLSSSGSKIKLNGDPQHAGFQFRASQEVAEKTASKTYYIRPDGVGKPGEEKQGGDYPWKGMSFVLGDQRYTAAYLDRPTNPKPCQHSERNYGRFGSYFVYEVTPEKPLEIAYRIWLQKGEMKAEEIAARDADFAKPVEVKVK
jgi:hypothetical protein